MDVLSELEVFVHPSNISFETVDIWSPTCNTNARVSKINGKWVIVNSCDSPNPDPARLITLVVVFDSLGFGTNDSMVYPLRLLFYVSPSAIDSYGDMDGSEILLSFRFHTVMRGTLSSFATFFFISWLQVLSSSTVRQYNSSLSIKLGQTTNVNLRVSHSMPSLMRRFSCVREERGDNVARQIGDRIVIANHAEARWKYRGPIVDGKFLESALACALSVRGSDVISYVSENFIAGRAMNDIARVCALLSGGTALNHHVSYHAILALLVEPWEPNESKVLRTFAQFTALLGFPTVVHSGEHTSHVVFVPVSEYCGMLGENYVCKDKMVEAFCARFAISAPSNNVAHKVLQLPPPCLQELPEGCSYYPLCAEKEEEHDITGTILLDSHRVILHAFDVHAEGIYPPENMQIPRTFEYSSTVFPLYVARHMSLVSEKAEEWLMRHYERDFTYVPENLFTECAFPCESDVSSCALFVVNDCQTLTVKMKTDISEFFGCQLDNSRIIYGAYGNGCAVCIEQN